MAINVLILLDGNYRFKEPAAVDDFTFITLVDTLEDAGFNVTRAHRNNLGASAVTDGLVDVQNFNFATSGNLLDYDVIWIFGYSGRNVNGSTSRDLTDDEINALTLYMDAGGGVFATGDHDSMGANLCGWMPRVRVMRAWFGPDDPNRPPELNGFPYNFPPLDADRADTVQRNPMGNYDLNNDGTDENHVYFENQSDSIPQPIMPKDSPAHPILRRNNRDITVFPDHMHEGHTLGQNDLDSVANPYSRGLPGGVHGSFVEFPSIDGETELPKVIATGQSMEYAQLDANTLDAPFGLPLAGVPAAAKPINTLCVYDGRNMGVGRIVTGSTFHHYIDINLTGDSDIESDDQKALTGADAAKGQGFNYPGAEKTFADIKAVFVNITRWLARVRPNIELIMERSTFSQDEVSSQTIYNGAFLVTVDGVKPSQFPGGPVDDSPSGSDLGNWAPTITVPGAAGIQITPISVASDNPTYPDIVQRITFTYRVEFQNEDAFNFPEDNKNFSVNASLTTPASATALTDDAWIQLVKSANPFMLDLDGGNTTTWLSSDVRVLTVVAGKSRFGRNLQSDATKAEAYDFLKALVDNITVSQFESLPMTASESALSPYPTTTESGKKVYNFAIARVRLNGQSASASNVRVFFRIFTSQTTAALTYIHPPGGTPTGGYKRTTGTNPIALPGTTNGGSEWLSFPFFAQSRVSNPSNQSDTRNVKDISPDPGSEVTTFFGALIDNNLNEDVFKPTPNSPLPETSLSDLLMGAHQCLVAQIEYAGTPIPSGSKPNTSDKLAQRNLAISAIANPGMTASRMALHTFEIEATPRPITEQLPPDELMLEWQGSVPDGTNVRITIHSWSTKKVIELADGLYPRHNLEADGDHTILLPGGGTCYVPIPRSQKRQTGVVMAQFPLGIRKGQRYDLIVRQITNRIRRAKTPRGQTDALDLKTAMKRFPDLVVKEGRKNVLKRGVFEIGKNQKLYTDLTFFNAERKDAIIYTAPDPKKVAAARREEGIWRETIGSFQMGIPVSTKDDMLAHYMRLYSVLSWRLEKLGRRSRWLKAFRFYVELIGKKVHALGANPFNIPPTRDGEIPGLPGRPDDKGSGNGSDADTSIPADGHGWVDDTLFGSENDDWLGGTSGLPDPKKYKSRVYSGKVSGLLYDHFGDFEGFTLESYAGNHLRFFSRESAIEILAERAWIQRMVVTVISVSAASRKVRRLLLRGYADEL